LLFVKHFPETLSRELAEKGSFKTLRHPELVEAKDDRVLKDYRFAMRGLN